MAAFGALCIERASVSRVEGARLHACAWHENRKERSNVRQVFSSSGELVSIRLGQVFSAECRVSRCHRDWIALHCACLVCCLICLSFGIVKKEGYLDCLSSVLLPNCD